MLSKVLPVFKCKRIYQGNPVSARILSEKDIPGASWQDSGRRSLYGDPA